ncbi:MAG: allophanate hydrolase subunit 1 [Candidatus Bathyarchaeia archaeon]
MTYKRMGELFLLGDYGFEYDLESNFRAIAVEVALRKKQLSGVMEVMPCCWSIGVLFNPLKLPEQTLISEMQEIEEEIGELPRIPSRLIEIPIFYNDPWTAECAKVHGVPQNQFGFDGTPLEFVAHVNGKSPREFVEAHSGADWWVAGVGFTPGTIVAYSMDPNKRVFAPKYKVPRTWTPRNAVGLGDNCCIYSVVNPGGVQIFGITPLNAYEPEQKNRIFQKNPVLFRVGDRIRWIPIESDEYERLRQDVERGTFDYEKHIHEESFDTRRYLENLG